MRFIYHPRVADAAIGRDGTRRRPSRTKGQGYDGDLTAKGEDVAAWPAQHQVLDIIQEDVGACVVPDLSFFIASSSSGSTERSRCRVASFTMRIDGERMQMYHRGEDRQATPCRFAEIQSTKIGTTGTFGYRRRCLTRSRHRTGVVGEPRGSRISTPSVSPIQDAERKKAHQGRPERLGRRGGRARLRGARAVCSVSDDLASGARQQRGRRCRSTKGRDTSQATKKVRRR